MNSEQSPRASSTNRVRLVDDLFPSFNFRNINAFEPLANLVPSTRPRKVIACRIKQRTLAPEHSADSRDVSAKHTKRGREPEKDILGEEPPVRRQRGEPYPRRAMWEGVTICTLNLRGVASNSSFVETELPALIAQITDQLVQLTGVDIKNSRLLEINFHGEQHANAENTKDTQQGNTVISHSPATMEPLQEQIVNASRTCVVGQQDLSNSSPEPESEFDSELAYKAASANEETDPEEYSSDYTSETDVDYSPGSRGENESSSGSSTMKDEETQEDGDDNYNPIDPWFTTIQQLRQRLANA
ncbi:hypothetical protein QBC42DRAFT_343329 [Cladorrhinum samala]|uniref:Uncharacterized protein n=1 Tax=Cladorrhinum samala TaxID=585594 RepID=A0AAV9I2M0_9PEZI|nr:hypothetical protein QBC42DRAFT_343329 [Cladorrhinum samala]